MTIQPTPPFNLDVSDFFLKYLNLKWPWPKFPLNFVNGGREEAGKYGEFFTWGRPEEILDGIELLTERLLVRAGDMIVKSGLETGLFTFCRTGTAPMGISCLIKHGADAHVLVSWDGLVEQTVCATRPAATSQPSTTSSKPQVPPRSDFPAIHAQP
jgi:hypothetical protein